ncbi:MAG: glycosyltransferase family 2 protein [Chthonomonas sp.]|nr:glycosyltransferase family 2 protein [Chthonomonas sp.]
MRVAVIIPAYNEEHRIANVLRPITAAALPHEILVVCDGCTDRTAEVAATFPEVRVIDLKQNVGKGGAMAMGVTSTDCEIICFVDADLLDLRPEHIDKIILPLLSGTADMVVGVFRGGKFWSETAQRVTPHFSGQRAMFRTFFASIQINPDVRFGIELALNQAAKKQFLRVRRVLLHGVSNTHKEEKMGFVQGTAARTKMYAEIAKALVQTRNREIATRKRKQRRSKNGRRLL